MRAVAALAVEVELTDVEIAGVNESVAASSQNGGIAEAEGRVVQLSAATTAGKYALVGESAGGTTSVLGQLKTGVATSGENRGRHGAAAGQAKVAAALGTEACELSSPEG
jgi:hypothetical protein